MLRGPRSRSPEDEQSLQLSQTVPGRCDEADSSEKTVLWLSVLYECFCTTTGCEEAGGKNSEKYPQLS